MSRRISMLVAVAALAVSSFAHAADRTSDSECTRQEKVRQETAAQAATQRDQATQQAVPSPTAAPVTLEEMFAASAEAKSIETTDGVSAMVGPIEVVIARIGPDGKPIMACVDDLEAARRFFSAPIEKLAPKQAKEQ